MMPFPRNNGATSFVPPGVLRMTMTLDANFPSFPKFGTELKNRSHMSNVAICNTQTSCISTNITIVSIVAFQGLPREKMLQVKR